MKIAINGYIISNEYKEVYDWFGYASCCPNDIINAKKEANGELLEITIGTCYGGSIFAGSEIGTEIKSHEGGAIIEITGLAASAASVIAMYAKSRMSPTAMMMVHNVSSMAQGDYHAMDKESYTLQQCNKAMASAYSMKSGMSEEEALKLMDDESWLTAEQAKEKGLIDEIMFDNSQLVASIGPGMIPEAVVEKIKSILAEDKSNKDNEKSEVDIAKVQIAQAKLDLFEKSMNI